MGLKKIIGSIPVVGPLARTTYRALRDTLSPTARRNARYDREAVELMRRVLAPDSVCVDVGAHTGTILRHMVELAPRARHWAFEPLPELAAGLRRDFPGVEVRECALSDAPGRSSFCRVKDAPGYSGLKRRVYDHKDPVVETIEVKVERLDDVLPKDARVAFVKIDVEGAELLVLKGGLEMIRRCRPHVVFEAGKSSTSCYGVGPGDLFDLLAGAGLEVSTMARRLANEPPLSREELARSFERGADFYFHAGPPRS